MHNNLGPMGMIGVIAGYGVWKCLFMKGSKLIVFGDRSVMLFVFEEFLQQRDHDETVS